MSTVIRNGLVTFGHKFYDDEMVNQLNRLNNPLILRIPFAYTDLRDYPDAISHQLWTLAKLDHSKHTVLPILGLVEWSADHNEGSPDINRQIDADEIVTYIQWLVYAFGYYSIPMPYVHMDSETNHFSHYVEPVDHVRHTWVVDEMLNKLSPGTKLIAGAPAGIDVPYMRECFKYGLGDLTDLLSVNTYRIGWQSRRGVIWRQEVAKLIALKDAMAEFGILDSHELWITESGVGANEYGGTGVHPTSLAHCDLADQPYWLTDTLKRIREIAPYYPSHYPKLGALFHYMVGGVEGLTNDPFELLPDGHIGPALWALIQMFESEPIVGWDQQ